MWGMFKASLVRLWGVGMSTVGLLACGPAGVETFDPVEVEAAAGAAEVPTAGTGGASSTPTAGAPAAAGTGGSNVAGAAAVAGAAGRAEPSSTGGASGAAGAAAGAGGAGAGGRAGSNSGGFAGSAAGAGGAGTGGMPTAGAAGASTAGAGGAAELDACAPPSAVQLDCGGECAAADYGGQAQCAGACGWSLAGCANEALGDGCRVSTTMGPDVAVAFDDGTRSACGVVLFRLDVGYCARFTGVAGVFNHSALGPSECMVAVHKNNPGNEPSGPLWVEARGTGPSGAAGYWAPGYWRSERIAIVDGACPFTCP